MSISFDPNIVDMGTVPRGGQAQLQTSLSSDEGWSGSLSISATPHFSIVGSPAPSGQKMVVIVAFHPAATGTHEATLSYGSVTCVVRGTAAESDITQDSPEVFKIHVPSPDAELQMGLGEHGFSGIFARASKGGMFLAASGLPKDIKISDCSYQQFKQAHTALTVGVSGATNLGLFIRTLTMGTSMSLVDLVVNGLGLGISAKGAITAGAALGTEAADGTIALYGESGVALASPLVVSASGGAAASLNGGLVASVNGMLAASVNAIFASMYGLYSATVSAVSTTITGDQDVAVSARKGKVSIEGATLEIGKASKPDTPGKAYWKPTTGKQVATETIDVCAEETITIEAGPVQDKVRGANTRIAASKDELRAETEKSALTLADEARLLSGQSAMRLGADGIKLLWMSKAVKDDVNAQLATAQQAWMGAKAGIDEIEKNLSALTYAILGTAAGAAGAGIPALLASRPLGDSASQGIGAASAVAGTALGGVGALAVSKIVEKILVLKANKAAKKRARAAYEVGVEMATTTEKAWMTTEIINPANPMIDVSDSGITLSVGDNKISITSAGITIETAVGSSVTVNNHTLANSGAAVLTVD
jgi:hypothetical protein